MPKVVLIDTEPHILALLKSRFEQEGFDVVSVGSAQLSGQQIAESRPDLIVFGRSVDECDESLESYKDLLELGDVPPVPIILLTASDAVAETGTPQHDVAQLKMPFRPSQLVALARRAVASA